MDSMGVCLVFFFRSEIYITNITINYAMKVQVKSDPSGRLVVSGEPEQPDNPWGVTPFKKVL